MKTKSGIDEEWDLALCPNGGCDHSAYVHDIYERGDPRHACCIDGCECGKSPAVQASGGQR